MRNYIKKMTILLLVMVIVLPISLPIISKAVNFQSASNAEISLDVKLKRDEENPNIVHITATDTTYKITDLKYVHQYIETSNVDYFEEDHEEIYTFNITPEQTIEETFELDGYGSYTVYAKNERGDRFLARITINDPNDLPQITLSRDKNNPLYLTIHVTSINHTITKLKIAKKQNISDNIDFSVEGTDIQFEKSNNVNVQYTEIEEEGLYVIYAEDSEGNKVTRQIYLAEETTPIQVTITQEDSSRKVNLEITDAICNIIKVKVAKKSEITDFDDFETKGETLSTTESRNINVSYVAPEDNTYVFYVEDEAGYKKMIEKRITLEEKIIQVSISQDSVIPNNLKITATDAICNIVEMKIAIGNDIDMDYFKNNGESIPIKEGKEVTVNYTVDENCMINVYVKDEQGYSYLYKKQIIGVDEPQPNDPPQVILEQNAENPKQIDVTVTDKDSYIDEIKWAKGSQTISYFANNGTRIGQGSAGSRIHTEFTINAIGTYTVYAKDEDGNEVVKEIHITNIEETPKDTTPPSIKTTNESINENESVKVTIQASDTESQIKTIKIASGNQTIDYFENEGTTLNIVKDDKTAQAIVMITKNGTYTIYAEDEKGNASIKAINITEIVIPDPDPEPEPDDTITSSVYEIDENWINRISLNTNLETFKENISTEIGYTVENMEGIELKRTDVIGTGYKLITETGKQYILIVTGDLNSDGKITLTDMSILRKHYLQVESLQGEYLKAADMDNNDKISLNDISVMRKQILEIE